MKHLFPHKFYEELKNGVPGEKSHLKMAPTNRPLSSLAIKTSTNIRESAVSINLFADNSMMKCLLIKRPTYEGVHSGQISFPGGKKEIDDEHLEHTARRETYEEVGIPTNTGILLGELTEVYIPVSSFLVKPYIFYHEELPNLTPDTREVEQIFSFPLSELLDDTSISTMEVRFSTGIIQKNIPCFILDGKEIWGATALILNELRDLILKILDNTMSKRR